MSRQYRHRPKGDRPDSYETGPRGLLKELRLTTPKNSNSATYDDVLDAACSAYWKNRKVPVA